MAYTNLPIPAVHNARRTTRSCVPMHIVASLLLSTLFAGATARDVLAETCTWQLRANTGPSPRFAHAMAYDSRRGETVLFGGADENTRLGDTWVWDGTSWTRRASSGPSQRAVHAMAYDSARGVTVLFGGIDLVGPLGDTWEWDGISWRFRSNSGPSPRWTVAMAYDSARRVTVLFGGDDVAGTGGKIGDTWEWDGTSWTRVATTGPPASYGSNMAYDSTRAVTVLSYRQQTWEWNGTLWTRRNHTGPPGYDQAMAYDSARDVTVVFPNERTDTFEWDGNRWTHRHFAALSRRVSHRMVYDSARHVGVLFGGFSWPTAYGDTWELVCFGLGDLNCDGAFNGADIDPFFLALGDPAAYQIAFPNCDPLLGDMNSDGRLDGGDIDPFFACLGGNCP